MSILTLAALFALPAFFADSYIILKKDTDNTCSLNIDNNSSLIEKTYNDTTITCTYKQLEYNASCSLFVITKKQFNESFVMRYNNNSNSSFIINYQNSVIFSNSVLYGYITNYIFYNITNTPIFRISHDSDVEYNITSLNDYSDFDLRLITAIYTSILFDGGDYPTKNCTRDGLIFMIVFVLVCTSVIILMMCCYLFN